MRSQPTPANKCILTINGGSSSIKFALFSLNGPTVQLLRGAIKSIGSNASFGYSDLASDLHDTLSLNAKDSDEAIQFLLNWIFRYTRAGIISAIGHRVVHGLGHRQPERISPELLTLLKSISAFAPEHLPAEVKLIEECASKFPDAAQFACFDTSFHTEMPMLGQLLSLPKEYLDKGIRRYGFHGISYEYLMSELNAMNHSSISKHRVILAHLGSGSSLVAIEDGKPIDTTMGFTPSSGVMMGTRTGDLDAGLVSYLLESENLSPAQFSQLVNDRSGLLGVSGISGDVLELLAREKDSEQARLAIDLYCYQIRKAIGAMTAALGGLDTLVFSGGIGENSPQIRQRICHGLKFLGIDLDDQMNVRKEAVISTSLRNVVVRVISTNEELMIARKVSALIHTNAISNL